MDQNDLEMDQIKSVSKLDQKMVQKLIKSRNPSKSRDFTQYNSGSKNIDIFQAYVRKWGGITMMANEVASEVGGERLDYGRKGETRHVMMLGEFQ